MSEEYKKNYEKYLKIANKIKDREERSFIVCFLISEGKKKAEKEIEELKATISKMEITTEKNSEVEELKKQIEKMKCCGNCKYYVIRGTKWCLKNEGAFFECNLSEDWELAE